jgi:hypothetical protein
MGTPFSATVYGGRGPGAGGSDASFSVPAGKVLEIRDITGYIRPDEKGCDIVWGPFVSTTIAGTDHLCALIPQHVGLGEGLGPRYNIHESATWFAEGNVNVEMRTSGATTWSRMRSAPTLSEEVSRGAQICISYVRWI